MRPRVRQRVVDAALADPERSPRDLTWQLTDRERHFLSESSFYLRGQTQTDDIRATKAGESTHTAQADNRQKVSLTKSARWSGLV